MATYIDIESIDVKIPGGLQPQTFTQSFDKHAQLVRKDFAFPQISKLNVQGNIRVDIYPNDSVAGGTGVIVIAPEATMDYVQIIETESEMYIALRRDVAPSREGIAARIAIFANDVSKIRVTDNGRIYGYLLTPQSNFVVTAQNSAYCNFDGLTTRKDVDINCNNNSTVIAKNFVGIGNDCYWARNDSKIIINNLQTFKVVLNADRHSAIVADGMAEEVTTNAASSSSIDARELKDSKEYDSATRNSRVAGSSANPSTITYDTSVVENAPKTEVVLGVSGQETVSVESIEDIKVLEIPYYQK